MPIQKILVVEDSATERYFIAQLLRHRGYTVVETDDGAHAFDLAVKHQPDLVLMDVVMPEESGFSAARRLSRASKTEHIPIVLCSSKSSETDRIWGLRQGARDYLVKPIQSEALFRCLDEIANEMGGYDGR